MNKDPMKVDVIRQLIKLVFRIIKISLDKEMNLLSLQSCKRLETYFKFVGQIANYKQLSYLSFFLNQKGDKLLYDENLKLPPLFKDPTNTNKYSLEQYLETVNLTYLFSQTLLSGLFNNHIMTHYQTQNLLQNCVNLQLQAKKDMVNFMFGNRISYNIKNWLESFKKGQFNNFDLNFQYKDEKFPDEKKRNFFVILEKPIHNYTHLQTELLHKNYFLEIPNINKILCLDLQVEDITRFNNQLLRDESFFKEKNIRIKNLSTDKVPPIFQQSSLKLGFRIHKLFEYISKANKSNTLLHQMPEYYRFYNEASKSQNSGALNLERLQPKQTFVFLQRKEGTFRKSNEKQFTFEEFTKSFTYRFQKDPYYSENKNGFLMARYLSYSNKKKIERLIKMEQKGKVNIPID